jgi:hypothetical protein
MTRALVVFALLLELARRHGRYEWIGINLAVRMMERHANFDAAILEGKHILNLVARSERCVPIGPDVHQELEVRQRQQAERCRGILREHHHFADPAARRGGHAERWRRVGCQGERWKHVLENGDVPRTGGNLRRMPRIAARRKRVVLRRRKKCSVLPMAGVCHPFAAQRMPSQVRVRALRHCARTRCGQIRRQRIPRVERQQAPVRLS